MSTPNSHRDGQLFDLKQRADGAWIVWTRKSQAELGMVDRDAVDTARASNGQGRFTDDEWTDFLRQPHLSEPTVWVIAAAYEARPSVEAVLNLLGVKRKPRPDGAPRKDGERPRRGDRRQPREPRPAAPAQQEAA